jgi:RNA polymerase sigma factor (TIGR02999 family)
MKDRNRTAPKTGNDGTSAATAKEVTRILNEIDGGTKYSTDELIPLVYTELRKVAAHKLALEQAGQTLQPTALVHEAYLRLVKPEAKNWNNQRHFFCVSAEAMRRILIENSRRKKAIKRGGNWQRTIAELNEMASKETSVDILEIDEALEDLCRIDEEAGELVKLRYFVGLTFPQIAETMGISKGKAEKIWAYSKAWLYRNLKSGS